MGEELISDTDLGLGEGIPNHDEDARVQYVGRANQGTPEELSVRNHDQSGKLDSPLRRKLHDVQGIGADSQQA